MSWGAFGQIRVVWMDGRGGKLGIWDGEGASRPTPRITCSPEIREELELVQAVPRLSARFPPSACRFLSVRLQTS